MGVALDVESKRDEDVAHYRGDDANDGRPSLESGLSICAISIARREQCCGKAKD
jgi:hypothetical protein